MVMQFAEAFDGEALALDQLFAPESNGAIRADLLHYMMFHPLNLIKTFPSQIELCR